MFGAGERFDHRTLYKMKGVTIYEENHRLCSGRVPVPGSGHDRFGRGFGVLPELQA